MQHPPGGALCRPLLTALSVEQGALRKKKPFCCCPSSPDYLVYQHPARWGARAHARILRLVVGRARLELTSLPMLTPVPRNGLPPFFRGVHSSFSWSMDRIVCKSTLAPLATSPGLVNSWCEWLMPPTLGTKIMATGAIKAISCES